MPGLEQGAAAARSLLGQQRDLARRRRGRLLQHHVTAGAQRLARRLEMHLRRRADRHAVQIGNTREHGVEIGEARDTIDAGVAAGAGHQFETRVARDGGDVLVARDLAYAKQACPQPHLVSVYWPRMVARKSAAGVSSFPFWKSNSVAFSQCEPEPQRVLQLVETQAGSQ